VVEREASGDFDYLWEDSADVDGLTSDYDALEVQSLEEVDPALKDPEDDLADDPGDNFWDNQPDPDADPGVDGQFDAFNDNTWSFTPPPPPPWYRTKPALTAIVAAAAALVAITVSGVLLVFRGADGTVDNVTSSSVAPTAPTSAEPLGTSAAPEPSLSAPPPPPPPPPETAAPVNTAPNRNDPTVRSRPTKAPEIGVTRTPVTRAPISVAPQPRAPRGNG